MQDHIGTVLRAESYFHYNTKDCIEKKWVCRGIDGHTVNKSSCVWIQRAWENVNRAFHRDAKWQWHEMVSKRPKTLMPSGRNHRRGCMGILVVTNANILAQGTHPSSVLQMERSVENVAKTTTSRQYAGHHRQQVSPLPKILNKVQQEGETSPQMPENQDQSFDMVE